MPDQNYIDSSDANPKAELLVDAPAGAEAFASGEGSELHHALVGVEKESINVSLVLGIVLGTVVIIAALVLSAFTMTEVTSQETQARVIAETGYPELREVRAAAAKRLTQYDIVNADESTYQIPIDQAINLMVNEAYQDQQGKTFSSELSLLPSR